MATLKEKVVAIVIICVAICVVIIAGSLAYSWLFNSNNQPQYINAPINYGTVPTPTPAPLPQVLQMTVARVTYLNGYFEVDGTDGKVAYFPDLNTCQTIIPGATYLFTPYGMNGNVYLIRDSVTILRGAPYRHYYGYNGWQSDRIYSDADGYWQDINGEWTSINYRDIPTGIQIYSSK